MPTRAENRAELTRAILDRAAAQLAEVGPAALSVRQIARDLGLASSAVYRYFPSRDALLTALLVQAFDAVGQAVEDGAASGSGVRERFLGACHGLRDWARDHPHEYALAYGSPVPGYAAPPDTVTSYLRVALVLLGTVRDAQLDGRPVGAPTAPVTATEREAVRRISTFVDPPLDDAHTARALVVWVALLGHVSLELFGHTANAVLDHDEHFRTVVEQLADDLGL
ncbi:TetR/AcrR family transcriptional regulator [Nocardioides anomalus]|uniref:TetR/AcrR family transcriptional regulator n=1 Tax=Nocardioides anomalus TaxID=2712223 RepID=A0A6G6WBE0_9ACTN|nr:TetR/AcrR family transcriptional regulator [Nocardioides anomalus]QIG42661.1 TetR/AcrR family transcriptional regulator [Nocardioides anomalus]